MSPASAGAVLLVAIVGSLARVSAQAPAVESLVARASTYVVEFQKQLSGIVAEETYEQEIKVASGYSPIRFRRLRSDLLLVRPVGSDRYVEFRDVFEVDGQGVRDRQERLTRLFLDPPPGALSQLERVAEESARYNIGNFTRTMNTPLLPLAFLLPRYRERFAFKADGRIGPESGTVRFKETEKPTLIRTAGGQNLVSEGRFWINAATGAVTRTELLIEQSEFTATVDVTYRLDANLKFLVPAEMKELYVTRRDRLEGRASYGRFRQFQVNVDEAIKPVKQP